MKKLMLVTSVIAVAGCMVTTISKDYSADEVESNEKLSFNKVDNLDDIESFDKSAIPVVVKSESTKEELYSPGGIHGLLWLCTLGIIPSWQTEAETHTMNVATPLGEKSGVCTVTKRRYWGWVPYMLPFSSSNEDAQCEEELLSRLASQWKKEWSAENVEKINVARSTRIKELRTKADALLAKKNYSEVMNICKTARSKSFVAEYMPKARAMLKQEVEVAMQNKDYQRVIDMLNNENGGSELGAKRTAAIVNLIADNANETTIDNLLKEYARELSLSQLAEIERKSANNAVKTKLVVLQASIIETSDKKIEAEIRKFVASRKLKSDPRRVASGGGQYHFSKSDAQHLARLLAKINNPNTRSNAFNNLPREAVIADSVLNCLIEATDSPAILWWMIDGIQMSSQKDEVWQRLLPMLDKVTDEHVIEGILSGSRVSVDKPEQRIILMKKLPESRMVALALEGIYNHSVYAWKMGNLSALETGIGITAYVKDSKSVVQIVAAVLSKIAEYRKECKKSWTMTWGTEDEEQAKKLIAGLPKLSDAVIVALVCLDESTWKYLIDKITEETAYNILTQGEAKSDELEVALVKKLSSSKVDMKVFAGVKTDAGKKAVMAAMPAEIKKAAQESTAKALAAVMDKAKEARKETFEMHGFYLGMDWEDMKLVLSYHFPDYEISEARDGDDKDADYVVYVTKQDTPFCYASAKDKKIYQFNFGKQVLKKWYKYDVQTYMEWVHAYARETKINMKFKMIEKDATVYEPMDMSRSYRVWFHQESYQYKHNTREYRLIYFGEEKDFTFEGGIGGAIIKEMAAPRFRYVRGDPGSLRVAIEND